MSERERLPAGPSAAHQTDRINVNHERDGAPLVGRLWIEDHCGSHGHVEPLHPLRMLVQQVAQAGGIRGC